MVEQESPPGQLVVLKKIDEVIVQVPFAAGDVEKRIADIFVIR